MSREVYLTAEDVIVVLRRAEQKGVITSEQETALAREVIEKAFPDEPRKERP
jgi:hypothetical protein